MKIAFYKRIEEVRRLESVDGGFKPSIYDVPDADVERWKRVIAAHDAVQKEMREVVMGEVRKNGRKK